MQETTLALSSQNKNKKKYLDDANICPPLSLKQDEGASSAKPFMHCRIRVLELTTAAGE
jgi:hypothetical protein